MRGEAQGDKSAERDATDRGPIDLRPIERVRRLLHEAVEVGALERKGDHAERRRQRLDRRTHVLPAALKAGNQHERWTAAAFYHCQFRNGLPVLSVC